MSFSIELQEKCGVVGVIAPRGVNASALAAKLGVELQHRGQDGAGIGVKPFSGNFRSIALCKKFTDAFPDTSVLEGYDLRGEIALAHTRYRTFGSSSNPKYGHPMLVQEGDHILMGVHNGNVANALSLAERLREEGVVFNTGGDGEPVSDTEVLLRRIAKSPGNSWQDKIVSGLQGVEGSFSVVCATDCDEMFAFRDPWGIRPLSYGRIDGKWVVVSETKALDAIRAVEQGEILKGELWKFNPSKSPEKIVYDNNADSKFCVFEDIYFSWPSSIRDGVETSVIRKRFGEELAREEKMLRGVRPVDFVTCIPDSARISAISFANAMGISYDEGIYKKLQTRSFIAADPDLRNQVLDDKYSYSTDLRGRAIYLLDDSSIRFKTSAKVAQVLRAQYGVREIHLRLPSPKFVRKCVLGTNINERTELGAVKLVGGNWMVKDDGEIARQLGVDSVAFLSMGGLARAYDRVGEDISGFCTYCLGGTSPDFDMRKYDPDLLRECYNLVLPVATVV